MSINAPCPLCGKRQGAVYFFHDRALSVIKIGFSTQVVQRSFNLLDPADHGWWPPPNYRWHEPLNARWDAIEGERRNQMGFLGAIPGDHALEAKWHRDMERAAIWREWFDAAPVLEALCDVRLEKV